MATNSVPDSVSKALLSRLLCCRAGACICYSWLFYCGRNILDLCLVACSSYTKTF